ncbi:MAG: UpxY family transcription antiterminator, partial [Terriglobales bacterium]
FYLSMANDLLTAHEPSLEGGVSASHGTHWYAIRTRSRHEKVVAKQLDGLGVENFLPLVTSVHRWANGPREVELPLFPGYAFVRLVYSPDQRVRVLRTHGVVDFVGTQGRGTPIPDKQIDDVKILLRHKVPFKNSASLRVGQKVRVRGGSIEGVEGILVARRGKRRLVIFIEPIQRSLSIDLEGYDVEPL